MNANELADALQETEPYYSTDYKLFDRAATMLRQQQAEIEALKSVLNEDQLYELHRKTMMTWNDVFRKAQEK